MYRHHPLRQRYADDSPSAKPEQTRERYPLEDVKLQLRCFQQRAREACIARSERSSYNFSAKPAFPVTAEDTTEQQYPGGGSLPEKLRIHE